MDGLQDSDHRYHGGAARLRSPHRLALLEIPRVTGLCRDGIVAESVLDVGTGTGLFAEAFAKSGLTVSGIDIDAALLDLARDSAPGVTFIQSAAERLPFADDSFDLVFLGLLLHETDDPYAALSEARRVARYRVAVLEWPYKEEPEGPPLRHRLREETIVGLANRAGFSRIEARELSRMSLYLLGT